MVRVTYNDCVAQYLSPTSCSDCTADRLKDVAAGVGLAKIASTGSRHGVRACLRVVVSRNEEDRRRRAFGRQLIPQVDPGYSRQLNVEYEAIEPWPLHVCAKRFRGRIGNGLHPGCTQQSGKRTEKALVVVDDSHVDVRGIASRHAWERTKHATLAVLPFREGPWRLDEQSCCLHQSYEFGDGSHLKLGRDGRAVELHHPFAYPQVRRNLLVEPAGDDVAQDITLPRC